MTKPVSIKEALSRLLKSVGKERRVNENVAAVVWPEVVGEKIDSVTKVLSVDKGLMQISVRDSVWRQELVMRKWEIIQKLNEKLGERLITDIQFR